MGSPQSSVDAFVRRATRWQGEIKKLRSILLGCGLDEALKWGKPCYMAEGRNVAIIQPFTAHCSLMFFKGSLFKDPAGLLRSQGEHSRSSLRLEFTSESQIRKSVVAPFVRQAIAIEEAGLQVDRAARAEPEFPEELTRRLRQDRQLERAFRALTPGRQRGYLLHFTSARQSATRSSRIEKCVPRILAGKGIHDR